MSNKIPGELLRNFSWRAASFLSSIAFAIMLMFCMQLGGNQAAAQSSATYIYTPLGYQQIVGLVSATSLTVPSAARVIEVCVESQAIRYRDDGTAPTSSVGMPVPASTCFQYSGSLSAIQFIQQSATATLDVSYYR